MGKDLPSVTGNDKPMCGPSGLYIVERSLTPREVRAIRVNAALEKFSTENITEPTKDQLEYERRGLSNIEAGELTYNREGARGNLAAHERNINRIEGPVEQRSVNTNLNVTLDAYLENLDTSDVTELELREAGIVIDAEVKEVIDDEEDYVADM